MSVLSRLLEIRRKQVLVRRFGRSWGQKLFDFGCLPDVPFNVDSSGNLVHAESGLCAGQDVKGVDGAVAGNLFWTAWAGRRGLKFLVSEGELLCEVDGIRMSIPNVNDYFTLSEVFWEEVYRFELPGRFVTIDVGANIGLSCLYLAKRIDGPIFAYELVPSTAHQARRNLELNPDLAERIEMVAEGLSEEDSEDTIRTDPTQSASNSMVCQQGETVINVRFRDAVAEFTRIQAAHPDRKVLVKLDVEGSEYSILESWETAGCLQRIDVLMLEWHGIEGENPEELRDRLRRTGFSWFERAHPTEPVGFINAWRGQAFEGSWSNDL